MTFPCAKHIDCPGSDSPLANLSCEGAEPDGPTYIGSYVPNRQDTDPLPNHFETDSCLGVCTSQISQADADHCAELAAIICLGEGSTDPTNQDPDPDPDDPTRTVYCNDAGIVQVPCPDGSLFNYPVAACRSTAFSKAEANNIAISLARNEAKEQKSCLSGITSECCVDAPYSADLTASGVNTGTIFNFWAVTAGALPDGLSLDVIGVGTSANKITGTPTVAGTFSFTIQFTDAIGGYTRRNYTICVIDITCDPPGSDPVHLPDAVFSDDYYAVLQAESCAAGALNWQVVGGALPIGLQLNPETGVVSGVCADDPGDYTFTIQLQTNAT